MLLLLLLLLLLPLLLLSTFVFFYAFKDIKVFTTRHTWQHKFYIENAYDMYVLYAVGKVVECVPPHLKWHLPLAESLGLVVSTKSNCCWPDSCQVVLQLRFIFAAGSRKQLYKQRKIWFLAQREACPTCRDAHASDIINKKLKSLWADFILFQLMFLELFSYLPVIMSA